MNTASPTLLFAFIAGLSSFLSPCILPVVPAFLAHLGGTSLYENPSRKRLLISSLLFVAGFSLVFGILGVLLNSFFRDISSQLLKWLSRLAGIIIIIFGLHITDIIDFEPFHYERNLNLVERLELGYFTSFVFGATFAVGWTPCVGPILGSVLSLAVTDPSRAFPLLTTYATGLGMPFVLVSFFPYRVTGFLDNYSGKLLYIQKFFGYILILLGVLVFTMKLSLIANSSILVELIS